MFRLLVLCGPPGCGKTTLIKEFLDKNHDFKFIDIFNYIQKYKDENGDLGPNGSMLAHQEMYQELKNVNGNIILEIGTNRAEFHFENISSLRSNYNIKILLCILDKEICIGRTLSRWDQNKTRNYPSREYLEEKFQRGFPEIQKNLAEDSDLNYLFLDMSKPTLELVDVLEE